MIGELTRLAFPDIPSNSQINLKVAAIDAMREIQLQKAINVCYFAEMKDDLVYALEYEVAKSRVT